MNYDNIVDTFIRIKESNKRKKYDLFTRERNEKDICMVMNMIKNSDDGIYIPYQRKFEYHIRINDNNELIVTVVYKVKPSDNTIVILTWMQFITMYREWLKLMK